jgi:hypothetical protein
MKINLSRYRHAGDKGKRSYRSYLFLTSELDGVRGQRHAPAALYPQGKDPGTQLLGGWVALRAGLATEAIMLCTVQFRTFCLSASLKCND